MGNVCEQHVEIISTVWPTCLTVWPKAQEKACTRITFSGHTVQLSLRYCPYKKQHDGAQIRHYIKLVPTACSSYGNRVFTYFRQYGQPASTVWPDEKKKCTYITFLAILFKTSQHTVHITCNMLSLVCEGMSCLSDMMLNYNRP
jgi:hypothetical protein